jgi:membrane-bound serine protease (ClpP class)
MTRFIRACGASRCASSVLPRPPTSSRRGWGLAVLFFALFAALVPAARAENESAREAALMIDVKGAIGFVSASHLTRALEKAKADGASLLIMRLDTPGGLLSSTRDMIQAMLASPVPIVVYVAPSGARAASAGTYLAYASHVAAMAPGTHLGAATPIALGVPGLPGSPPEKPSPGSEKRSEPDSGSASDRKSVNDAVAYLRTLAELRKRNAEWAETAVRDAATLTATDAHKKRVVEVIAGSLDEMLTAIDGRTVTTTAGARHRQASRGRAPETRQDH